MQERLIKNKTLLTAIEPAISCTSLEVSFHLDGDPDDDDDDVTIMLSRAYDDDDVMVFSNLLEFIFFKVAIQSKINKMDSDVAFQVLIGILQRRIELDKEVI